MFHDALVPFAERWIITMKNSSLINRKKRRNFVRQLPFHFMLLPGVVIVLIYNYGPMMGLVMAFQNFKVTKGFWGSEWVGLENFKQLLRYPSIKTITFNTLYISFFKLLLGLVVPVIFALMLNLIKNKFFSGFIQTVTCLPHFLSWVILGGIFVNLLSPSSGIINKVIELLGGNPLYFLGDNNLFPWTVILTDVWKNFGYNSIIYMAAMASIDPAIYEAAKVDGASRFKQTLHVTLPGILPMVFVMGVLSLPRIMNAGFDQIFNLYSPMVYESGDILDTFIYRMGLENAQYSFSTAVGLLKSVIGLILVATGYKLADKYGNYRVF